MEFAGGIVSGNITLDGTTANTFALSGADITGDVDLGDGAAHTVALSSGAIRGSLDIGSGTTELSINVAGGDTVALGTLETNSTTTTTINGTGAVEITTFTVNGAANQSAGTLTTTDLTVGDGGSFTQSGNSVLASSNVRLNGAATLNLNGTTARVTGPIAGGTDSRVFVNGTFTSENTINVGHFEITEGGVFNMAHDVTVTSPTTFANFGRLAVGASDTVTINGNYTQASNAIFQTDVANDTSFGRLVVTGTANLPSNARIDVNVADADFDFAVDEMQDIISAGTLTSDGTFIVTDNSNLFDFEALVSGDTVDLCLATAGGSCTASASIGVYEAVVATGNWPGVGAAVVFDDLIDTFVTAGTSGDSDMDRVIGSLGVLATQQEVSSAVSQTLPLLTASAAIPIENTLSTTRRIIQSRLNDSDWLRPTDPVLADEYIWASGFHTHLDHGDRRAVTGFNGGSTGFVFGADGNIGAGTDLGIAFAYSDTHVNSNTDLNAADIETYQVIGYGRHDLNASTNVNFQLGVGLSETDGQRTISFVDGTPVAHS
ncbi:autotransporter outer membrane beta-barrel domain-containing protein, partial [Hoeflea poritis]